MKSKTVLLLLLFSCANKHESKSSQKVSQIIDETMAKSTSSYYLKSVKSITIDHKTLSCDVDAMYDTSTKQVFMVNISVKNNDGIPTSLYITHHQQGEVVQIIASNLPQTNGLALYMFDNNQLTRKEEKGFKIENVNEFINTEKRLYKSVDSAIHTLSQSH